MDESLDESSFWVNFNIIKLLLLIVGALIIWFINTFDMNMLMIIIGNLLGWLMIGWGIALNRTATSLADVVYNRAIVAFPASMFMAVGTIMFHRYNVSKKYYNYYFIAALLLYVIGKAGIVTTELGLVNWTQILTVVSVALLVIAEIMTRMVGNFGDEKLVFIAQISYIVGWALFILGVSYNPIYKTFRGMQVS